MLVQRFSSPRFLPQGYERVLTFPVYEEGSLAAPSSGTYTLYKGVTSQLTPAVSVPVSTAQVTITAAATTALTRDTDYREVWLLTIGGVVYEFARDVYLVRRELRPVVADQDLIRVHSDLTILRPSNLASYEPYREEAWDQIVGRLLGLGNLPQLVTNSWAFRTAHLWLSLTLISIDFASQEAGQGKWAKNIDRYEKRYQSAWDSIQLEYDTDGDGAPDERKSGTPVYFLQGRPQRYNGGLS